jgi:hypothetical protein
LQDAVEPPKEEVRSLDPLLKDQQKKAADIKVTAQINITL